MLLLAIGFAGPMPVVRMRLAATPQVMSAGDAVRTLLRQTHIQILAAGAVGVADHVNSGFLILFQHHGHAGQGVGAGRLQVGAIAVEGDVIRHVQHDIVAISRHADPGSLHFVAQLRFLHVHVVTNAAAERRAGRCANQRAFAAVMFGRGERADASAH